MKGVGRVASVFLCVVGSLATRSSVYRTKSEMQKLPDIYWNTSNPIFRIDNTDHIIDVNQGTQAHEYDQINIICPMYPESVPEEETEKYVIYNVDKEDFDTCRIMNPHPRTMAVCNQPYKKMIFTISFRSFSPMPNTLEFRPGHDYYFISTSSPKDLHMRVDGYCRSNNMKVVFKVGDNTKPAKKERPPGTTSSSPAAMTTEPGVSGHFFSEKTRATSKKPKRKHRDRRRKKLKGGQRREEAKDMTERAVFNSNDIAQNDKPNLTKENESLVKRVKNMIKQEASTRMNGGVSVSLSQFTCWCAVLLLRLLCH